MRSGRAALIFSAWVGLAVFAGHGWLTMYQAVDAAASRWAEVSPLGFGERFSNYFDAGGFWLGYCYGVAAGFGLWSVLDWLMRRRQGVLAAGGVTFSGAIAAFACFMTGCCGSPMLGVWIGIFGAASAPFLGPAAALLTTVSVAFLAVGVWRRRRTECGGKACNC